MHCMVEQIAVIQGAILFCHTRHQCALGEEIALRPTIVPALTIFREKTVNFITASAFFPTQQQSALATDFVLMWTRAYALKDIQVHIVLKRNAFLKQQLTLVFAPTGMVFALPLTSVVATQGILESNAETFHVSASP
mmetsp:Transcript_7306/g.27344  ORF Transcript_7306/g.27344 Transcript_7306/m.27344 type:complete len:137 (-) Transcript_7306:2170-2580(-)